MSDLDVLDRLLGHDSWTTRQLLEIAASLPEAKLDQEFDIGHQTVRRTFEHIIWNIECWTDLMKGNGVRPRPVPHQPMSALIQRQEEASASLWKLARSLVGQNRINDHYFDTLDDPPTQKSYGGTLVHLATHGMHHRAQLLFLLRRLDVKNLPEGDALSWEHFAKETRNLDELSSNDAAPTLPILETAASSIDELAKVAVDLEMRVWNAVIKRDRQTLKELLAENYVELTLDGKRTEKTQIVEMSPQIDEIDSVTIDSEKVVSSGKESLMLNYHLQIDGKTSGQVITPRDRWATSYWICFNGTWQCGFFQQGPFQ